MTIVFLPERLGNHLARLESGGSTLDGAEGQERVLRCARSHPDWDRTVRLLRASLSNQAHVLLRRVPVENDAAVVAVCLVAGRPSPQPTPDGPRLFFDVRSLDAPYSTSTSPDAFDLHTDGTSCRVPDRVVALACRRADASGGGRSLVAPLSLVRAKLERRDPRFSRALEAPLFSIDGDGGSLFMPVLWRHDSIDCLRWRSESVKIDPSGERAQRAMAEAALSAMRQAVRAVCPHAYDLVPGDLLLIDNWRALHGRTAFAPGSQRWLRRLRCPTLAS